MDFYVHETGIESNAAQVTRVIDSEAGDVDGQG